MTEINNCQVAELVIRTQTSLGKQIARMKN